MPPQFAIFATPRAATLSFHADYWPIIFALFRRRRCAIISFAFSLSPPLMARYAFTLIRRCR